MSDMRTYKELEKARVASSTDNLANTCGNIVAATHTREQSFGITDANAATNLAETPIGVIYLASITGAGGKFVSGNVTPPANVVANTTNFVTVNVWKRPASNAASQVLIATANITANVVAFTPKALTVANAANAVVAAGDVITVSITKGGAGGYLASGANALIDVNFEDF
jgi:hypothetical protein